MHRFLRTRFALLHKEWRDVRAVTIACALLVPIGLLSLELGFLDWRGDFAASTYIPVCAALYLAIIAADLIAGDIATNRARSYAALPTRWSSLWATKVIFAALIGTAFTAWTVAVCAGLYATLAPTDAQTMFFNELPQFRAEHTFLGIGVVATIVFWSTVLERGFAVVGAALVTCAALVGIFPLVQWINPELLPSQDAMESAGMLTILVFLAGSLYGFVRAPQHSSTVWRRLATAMLIPIVVLVPTGAVSAAVLVQRLTVEPGNPDIQLVLGHVSPDGRRVVLLAAARHEHARTRSWILDLEDGSIAQLDELDLQADWMNPWSESGAYVAWERPVAREDDLRRLYDPETGAVRETRSRSQLSGRATSYPFIDWATTCIEGRDMIVTLTDGVERRIPANRTPAFSRIPGYALWTDTEGAHLHDLVSDTTRVLTLGNKYRSAYFSPSGAYVHTWSDGVQTVYETRTGTELRRTEGHLLGFLGGGAPDRYAIAMRGDAPTLIVDLETGTEHALDPDPNRHTYPGNAVRVRRDGRVLLLTPDGRVELRDLDGGNRRTVYPTYEEK